MNKKFDVRDPSVKAEESPYFWQHEPELRLKQGMVSPEVSTKLNVVDLFCGCGGFALGFEQAGFRISLGVDIHKPSLGTLERNHPFTHSILGDIRRVTNEMILSIVQPNEVSVVVAGVPCQGFSLCNRKRYDYDDRNYLFWEFIRVVELLSPDFVVLENVSGMRTTASGEFVRGVEDAIVQAGIKNGLRYRVDSRMLNAADFGVPQVRERLFFLGAREGLAIEWPEPSHGPGTGKKHLTVTDAISDLPKLDAGMVVKSYKTPPQRDYQREMRQKAKTLYNHEAPKHPQRTIDKIRRTTPGEPIYPRFKQRIRLDPEMPSPTQVSGGIRPQYQFGHPEQPRGLTVRERCRIQIWH
jgi:DNA (cytosine-5)-methyltransferase 1